MYKTNDILIYSMHIKPNEPLIRLNTNWSVYIIDLIAGLDNITPA